MSVEESAGVNPNVEVGDEPSISAGGGSNISFDDIDRVTSEKPAKPKKEAKPAKEAKPDDTDPYVDGDAKDETDGRDKKPKAKEGGDADAKETKEAKAATDAPKAKVHKVKVGDTEMDLAGDATLTIPINGKKEAVPLQDLINEYNGKTEWSRRFSDIDKRDKEVKSQSESLNSLAKNLYEKSQEDPEAGFDFLAEMTKQDPVEVKEKVLRQQIADILPLAEMSDEEREQFIEDKKRDWRDKSHASRTKALEDAQASEVEQAEQQKIFEEFGIDADRHAQAKETATNFLKANDPNFDGKISKEQIVYVDRKLLAFDVIETSAPHLKDHKDFEDIVEDMVQDLCRHPQMTSAQLSKLLVEVYGKEDESLRNLAKKRAKTATLAGDDEPEASRQIPNASGAVFFDDMF